MACPRCLWAVEGILNKLEIDYEKVKIGEIITTKPTSKIKHIVELKAELQKLGFELVEERKMQLVEQIKACVIYWMQHAISAKEKWTFSRFLVLKVNRDYSYLSTVFSEVESTTIERYIILQKIEKAKALIILDELNFAEISYEIGYSSPAHFSNQFKSVTGYSPLQFKKSIKNVENQKIM